MNKRYKELLTRMTKEGVHSDKFTLDELKELQSYIQADQKGFDQEIKS